MSVFEIIFIVCFGLAWPASIYKSVTSRSTKGKSLFFLFIIALGYVSGILHKYFYARDPVIFLYMLNLLMVTTDIVLFFRNKRYEARTER